MTVRQERGQAVLELQQVTYTYNVLTGQRDEERSGPAIRDLNLRVAQGEYLAILGHNGSGKSTLARLCNALLVPEKGQVLVAGRDTREEAERRAIRDDVGIIFQNPDNQIIATVVEDDIAWGLTMQGMDREEIRERVEGALMAVGIAHLRHQLPHKLSGGERQRLAIAGMLALRPRCLIADEATTMLDPLTRREIMHLLHQLNREQNLTIIQVTHLLEEAVEAERIVVMERGQIVLDGTPAVIFSDLERLRELQLAVPEPIVLAERLREAGMEIAGDVVTSEAIAEEIAKGIARRIRCSGEGSPT